MIYVELVSFIRNCKLCFVRLPSLSNSINSLAAPQTKNSSGLKESMDELEERDILWPDHQFNHCTVDMSVVDTMQNSVQESRSIRVSAPIAIPSREVCQRDILEMDSDEHDEGSSNNRACKKMIPPHVIVARRFADRMFSVCFGNGRTLRGRDLITFRNSIFRMTGFIE